MGCQVPIHAVLLTSQRLLPFAVVFTFVKIVVYLNHYIAVASVSYVNGKLFYMKYLLIFGIPSWFALADGMKPPAGPICISRISKYSQTWRSFDRGLYVFLKKQVLIQLPHFTDQEFQHFSRHIQP